MSSRFLVLFLLCSATGMFARGQQGHGVVGDSVALRATKLALTPSQVIALLRVPGAALFAARTERAPLKDNAGEFLPESVTKTSGCMMDGKNPDPACTPGAAMGISTKTVCTTSTKGRRHVTTEMRQEVFAAYGISFPPASGAFEVDHYIPLELGGSNDLANLWPEPASPTPGFRQKDCVENYLHAQVCTDNTMTLAQAQRAITSDWLDVYNTKAKNSHTSGCPGK